MVFSRQECWSGLPFPSPGDLLNPGTEPTSLLSRTGRRVLFHQRHLWILSSIQTIWEDQRLGSKTKKSLHLALECVWLLHLKTNASGVLEIHFKENNEDELRRGSGTEKDAWSPYSASLSSYSLTAMAENVCFPLMGDNLCFFKTFL